MSYSMISLEYAHVFFYYCITLTHYCFTLCFFIEKIGLKDQETLRNWRDVAGAQGGPVNDVSGVDI